MTEVAPVLDSRVASLGEGGCLVGFSHAASVALAASLLQSPIEQVGKLAPVGIIRLAKAKADSPWELLKQGEDNSAYISEELQSTKTFPWTFREDARVWWGEEVVPRWR